MIRLLLTVTALFALSACETVQGFGRDLGTAGQTISQVAEQTQEEL